MNVYLENLLKDKKFIQKLDQFIQKLPQIIMTILYLYIYPIAILVVASLFGTIVIQYFISFLPEKVNNIIILDNLLTISGGIFLGILLFPIFYRNITIDSLGEPKYKDLRSWKYIFFTFILSPLILGLFIEIFYSEFNYISAIYLFFEYSNFYIEKIIQITDSEYLSWVLPMIPIAIITMFFLKYLIFLFLKFCILYCYNLINLIIYLEKLSNQ